jgi:hypothetical protein
MTDPFLADSIQRVLAIQIHEIEIIPSQELQLLQAVVNSLVVFLIKNYNGSMLP